MGSILLSRPAHEQFADAILAASPKETFVVIDGDTLDGELDLQGSVTLFNTLASEFTKGEGDPVEIPLASVRGTIQDPRVAVGPGARNLLAGFFLGRNAGAKTLDAIESIFSRGAKKPDS